MKRLELICNVSLQEEALEILQSLVPGARYTLFPSVHGRGGEDFKLGTTVWPEENFLLLAVMAEADAERYVEGLRALKAQFPHEGLKVFVSDSVEAL